MLMGEAAGVVAALNVSRPTAGVTVVLSWWLRSWLDFLRRLVRCRVASLSLPPASLLVKAG
jgi:hypothetical protein